MFDVIKINFSRPPNRGVAMKGGWGGMKFGEFNGKKTYLRRKQNLLAILFTKLHKNRISLYIVRFLSYVGMS